MSTPLINIAVPVTFFDAEDATGVSTVFALPTAPIVLSWQVSLDDDIGANTVSVVLEASIDGILFITIGQLSTDDFSSGDSAMAILSQSPSARFLRSTIQTNDDDQEITVTVLCKRAN